MKTARTIYLLATIALLLITGCNKEKFPELKGVNVFDLTYRSQYVINSNLSIAITIEDAIVNMICNIHFYGRSYFIDIGRVNSITDITKFSDSIIEDDFIPDVIPGQIPGTIECKAGNGYILYVDNYQYSDPPNRRKYLRIYIVNEITSRGVHTGFKMQIQKNFIPESTPFD